MIASHSAVPPDPAAGAARRSLGITVRKIQLERFGDTIGSTMLVPPQALLFTIAFDQIDLRSLPGP